MTPERLKELELAGDGRLDRTAVRGDRDCRFSLRGHKASKRLTWGELRALLAIAQRAGETCEWVETDQYDIRPFVASCDYDQWKSSTEPAFCPQCGRTVAVRDGRTT